MGLPPGTPELKVLDLLVSVAETGSLGQAAVRHGISQPAASMRISALERQLRLVLLERGPTGSRLTPAGATVVDWARPVLDAARALVSGVVALHADQQGRLRIAASMTIADHRIPGWLIALGAKAPQVKVGLRVGNSEQVADMVRRREADLGFVEGPRAPLGLRSRAVGGDELVVVVSPDHGWARRRRPLPLRTLAATPLILREQGSGTRDALWELLRKAGEPASPAAELGSTAAIKAAVTAGGAPAALSRLAVSAELGDRRLIHVPLDMPGMLRRTFRAVWLPDTPPTGPAATLLGIATRR
ncbi:LysR family transcriptional regulator [Streptomyces cavernae]|uniref:LysR family transcriptional regulator n=1 Tax=Streptomyces cavernae TaxID=2259034 RepID=UPI000FEBA3C6|nr:LysR family transcriptional regulator [Streptomyces cavernae]